MLCIQKGNCFKIHLDQLCSSTVRLKIIHFFLFGKEASSTSTFEFCYILKETGALTLTRIFWQMFIFLWDCLALFSFQLIPTNFCDNCEEKNCNSMNLLFSVQNAVQNVFSASNSVVNVVQKVLFWYHLTSQRSSACLLGPLSGLRRSTNSSYNSFLSTKAFILQLFSKG